MTVGGFLVFVGTARLVTCRRTHPLVSDFEAVGSKPAVELLEMSDLIDREAKFLLVTEDGIDRRACLWSWWQRADAGSVLDAHSCNQGGTASRS
jgi:hypothetical protein